MIFSHVAPWLVQYNYFILFPLVAIEGPIVTVMAGSMAALGLLNFYIAYVVVIAGDLAGDSIYYLIGRYAGEPFITRWGKYFGIDYNHVAMLKEHFDVRGGRTLALGKVSHGIGGIFLAAAGMSRMSYGRFLWFNFLATLVKSIVLLAVGFYFGQAVAKINYGLRVVSIILFAVVFVAIGYYYLHRKYTRKSHD